MLTFYNFEIISYQKINFMFKNKKVLFKIETWVSRIYIQFRY